MELKDKIIFYLTFTKSKLNPKYIGHKEAKEEIDEIINKLKQAGLEEELIQENERHFS